MWPGRDDVEMRMRSRRRAAGASRPWPAPAPPPSPRSRAAPDSVRRPPPAPSRSGRRRARAGRARPCRAAPGSVASSSCEPAISQAIESHTRTVIAGGAARPPSPRRNGDRTSRPRRPRPSPASSRRRARPGAARREAAEAVLNPVQMLDQQVAPAGIVPQQREHLLPRLWVDPSPLGSRAHAR